MQRVRVRLRGDIPETLGIICVKGYVGIPDGQRKVIDEYQEQERTFAEQLR